MSTQPPNSGPWDRGITAAERQRRWRQMTLEAMHYCGHNSAVLNACIAAELDPRAAEWAWSALQTIDSRRRELILHAGETRAHLLPASAKGFRLCRAGASERHALAGLSNLLGRKWGGRPGSMSRRFPRAPF